MWSLLFKKIIIIIKWLQWAARSETLLSSTRRVTSKSKSFAQNSFHVRDGGLKEWLYIINWKLKLLFIGSFIQINTRWFLGISYFSRGGGHGTEGKPTELAVLKPQMKVQNATRAAWWPPNIEGILSVPSTTSAFKNSSERLNSTFLSDRNQRSPEGTGKNKEHS